MSSCWVSRLFSNHNPQIVYEPGGRSYGYKMQEMWVFGFPITHWEKKLFYLAPPAPLHPPPFHVLRPQTMHAGTAELCIFF